MTDELVALKKHIEEMIISERNHIIKYTSPFISPNSEQAKAVFREYDLNTDSARIHNNNVRNAEANSPYGDIGVEELPVPTLYDFVVTKLKYFGRQRRRDYADTRIMNRCCSFDEDGMKHMELCMFEYLGETDHEVFKTWLLFEHLFELSSQLVTRLEARNYAGIYNYLKLIDDTFSFLMDGKKSYFQLKMDEDELNGWLINEINAFKHQVETKGLWPKLREYGEKYFQRVFESALSRVAELYNIDISPETGAGGGFMDFKFSQGNESKICVELKLSSNNYVVNGLMQQLERYKESEKTDKGIYVILDKGNGSSSFRSLKQHIQTQRKQGLSTEHIIIIDAKKKPSPSNI